MAGFTLAALATVQACGGKKQIAVTPVPDVVLMETVATLQEPPGNIAITPEGRRFVSIHPFGQPTYRVMELADNGFHKPYPTEDWSKAPAQPFKPGAENVGLISVIGLRAGEDGILWILDMGPQVNAAPVPRLIGWDTRKEKLHKVIEIPPKAVRPNSFFQDFALDQKRNYAYIADMTRGDLFGPSTPAVVVVNLKTGRARRVLEGDEHFAPDDSAITIGGKTVKAQKPDGTTASPQLGLNPIAIDPATFEYVYFGAMNGRTLSRIKADDLVNEGLMDSDLAARVSLFGEKPVSDGIIVDTAGNVYATDLNGTGIGYTKPDGTYVRFIMDAILLQWPDGFAAGPDGFIYVTVNQLHRFPIFNEGRDGARRPFRVMRFQPVAPPLPPQAQKEVDPFADPNAAE